MTVRRMLDTNTITYAVTKRFPGVRERLQMARNHFELGISVITEAEIRYGLIKRPVAPSTREALERFLNEIAILPWTRQEVEIYARLRSNQEKAGKSIESHDLLIAAHALSWNATLVTADKAFRSIPELRLENWATDLQ